MAPPRGLTAAPPAQTQPCPGKLGWGNRIKSETTKNIGKKIKKLKKFVLSSVLMLCWQADVIDPRPLKKRRTSTVKFTGDDAAELRDGQPQLSFAYMARSASSQVSSPVAAQLDAASKVKASARGRL